MTAERLMLLAAILAFLLTIEFVRKRTLREKYAVAWLLVATGLLILGVFPQLIMLIADQARLAYPSAVLFATLGMIYVFSMSVSVSLSRRRHASLKLTQEVALLRYELETLRAQIDGRTNVADHESTESGSA